MVMKNAANLESEAHYLSKCVNTNDTFRFVTVLNISTMLFLINSTTCLLLRLSIFYNELLFKIYYITLSKERGGQYKRFTLMKTQ